jgi:hypothetical protein
VGVSELFPVATAVAVSTASVVEGMSDIVDSGGGGGGGGGF